VRKAPPVYFFPDGHAGALGDSARGEILGANQGDQPLSFQVREGPVAASDGGFGREPLTPEVAAEVVSDFVELLAFDLLQDDSAVADDFLSLSQLHGPEADAVILVALAVAFNPLLDTGAIVGCGVIAHGFGIGEDLGESVGVLGSELAQEKTRSLEDRHVLSVIGAVVILSAQKTFR